MTEEYSNLGDTMIRDLKSELVDMLKLHEGVRSKSYLDTVNKVTVGVGFNMDDPKARDIWYKAGILEDFNSVYKGDTLLSEFSIKKLLNYQIEITLEEVKAIFPKFDRLNTDRKLALLNMHFQLGNTRFKGFKKMINAINNRDFETAKKEALDSKWAKQTPNRAKEVTELLFNEGN